MGSGKLYPNASVPELANVATPCQTDPRRASAPRTMANGNLSAFIWSVADLLRGDYKPSDYGKVILPFTILRRLDCCLEPTRTQTLEEIQRRKAQDLDPAPFLSRITGYNFYNARKLGVKSFLADPNNVKQNLAKYVQGFSPNVADIFDKYEFDKQIDVSPAISSST